MTHINTEFPYRLGPTNPCPIAVHMDAALLCRAECVPSGATEGADYILQELSYAILGYASSLCTQVCDSTTRLRIGSMDCMLGLLRYGTKQSELFPQYACLARTRMRQS